jgi:hypothetical protein
VSNPDHQLVWPARYKPSVPGFQWTIGTEGATAFDAAGNRNPPTLGQRFDGATLDGSPPHPFKGNVHITLLRTGTTNDGNDAIDGTSVYYLAKRAGPGWTVELVSWGSP